MTAADALALCMEKASVKRIYGVVGTSVVSFLNALYPRRGAIRYISCRHEQVSASMADAEGRLTGRPGVSLSHSGPGTLNTAISLAIALKDCSPLVAVSGAVGRAHRGGGGFLEVDHGRVFRPICKTTLRAEEAADIPRLFGLAWHTAVHHPRGPVLLEIPEDLWGEEVTVETGAMEELFTLPRSGLPPARDQDVTSIIDRLGAAARPVFLAGGGILQAGAETDFAALAEAAGIPVVTTGNGRGALSERHPLCYGRAGFGGGNPMADHALLRADLIIALGATLSDMTTYGGTWGAAGPLILIHADAEALEADDRAQIVLKIHADAGEAIRAISRAMSGAPGLRDTGGIGRRAAWIAEMDAKRTEWNALLDSAADADRVPLSPSLVMKSLGGSIPHDAIVTTGQGVHLQYANNYLPCLMPRTYLSSNNFGAMGFGLPAAMAAAAIHPGRCVIAVLGDGEFMMTLQDLETVAREKLAVKIIVINDNAYRVLWLTQRVALGGETYGTEHTNPDVPALAAAFGIPGYRIAAPDQVDVILRTALADPGPALIEVVADRQDMAPTNIEAIVRMKGLPSLNM